jgi:hypothetical protein
MLVRTLKKIKVHGTEVSCIIEIELNWRRPLPPETCLTIAKKPKLGFLEPSSGVNWVLL